MDNNYTIPSESGCVDLNQAAQQFCIPRKLSCNISKGGLILDDPCQYRCRPSKLFYMPLYDGDVFCLQTKFFNVVPNVFICVGDTETSYNSFECATNGFNGEFYYQTFCFNADTLPDCFSLKFENGEEVCYSPFYKKYKGDKFVTIESEYNFDDCFSNYYGGVDCVFSNKIRIPYELCYNGNDISDIVRVNNDFVKSSSRDYYRLYPCGDSGMPDYFVKYLKMIFQTGTVIIDGNTYHVDSVPRIAPISKDKKLFAPEIEVYQSCEVDSCKN